MIYAKRIVLGLNRFYRGHFQNTSNIKTFFGYVLWGKLQRGMLHAATCLLTPLQHKLQRKLHRVTLAVGLCFIFCNDSRHFIETIASCSSRLQSVICLLQLAIDLFFIVAGQIARKIAWCNTSLMGSSLVQGRMFMWIFANSTKMSESTITECHFQENWKMCFQVVTLIFCRFFKSSIFSFMYYLDINHLM